MIVGQYTEVVDRRRKMIKAEKWAKGIKTFHAHSLDSMYYDHGRKDGSVIDIEYNSGLIERTIKATGEKVYFGTKLEGTELLRIWERRNIS